MRHKQRLSILLALVLALACTAPAMALEEDFTDPEEIEFLLADYLPRSLPIILDRIETEKKCT